MTAVASLIAVVCAASLCSASMLVERHNGDATVIQCPYDPPTVYGHPAFGLLDSLRCPSAASEANDELQLCGVPLIAQLLGGNGTAVLSSGQDVLFRGIGGTAADVTASMETRGGWTVVLMVRLNRTSSGALMALFDDSGPLGNAIEVEAALRNCSGESCSVAGLFAAVVVMGATERLQVIAPEVLERGVAGFTVPALFDGEWHLLGIVFEPMAAGHYVRVSLHVDGVDPFTAKLEQCGKAGAAQRLLTSSLTPWNTSRGALSVGGAQGSYHALLLYREALSRLAISAFGTSATKETAAGGSRGNLLAVCFTFIAVAVVLSVWAAVHFYCESYGVKLSIEGGCNLQHELDKNGNSRPSDDMVMSEGSVANKASVGAPHAAQMASSAAAAVSSIRASAAPVASSSAAVLVSITSISFEVPQQMSVLFSRMTFPSVFRDVFGNLFNMWSIRFDFPEVAVPPYAPLLVVLVGLSAAGVAAVWQGVKDRNTFAASLQNWDDRRTSYRILLQYIVRGVFRECKIDENDAEGVVTALAKEFPTPAGRLSGVFFDDVLASVVQPPQRRATVARALRRRCQHLLEVIPSDTVTTLCMCLIPQATSRVVSVAEVSAMSRKLQTLAKSFDRTLWEQSFEEDRIEDQPVESMPSPTAANGDRMDGRVDLKACYDAFAKLVASYNGSRLSQSTWARPLVTEKALLAHINAFVRAVLTWAVRPDDVHMKAFADPFLEFHCLRKPTKEIKNLNIDAANKIVEDVEEGEDSMSVVVKDGLLQSCRQALILYSVLRSEEAMGIDKAPPYNRQAPTRKYWWLKSNCSVMESGAELLSAHNVQLRMMAAARVRNGIEEGSERQANAGDTLNRCGVPTTASRCCALHSDLTVVKASESLLMSTTLDGRPMYRCCNSGFDQLKEALHGKEHGTGDECDDGEVFMCPEATCSFAICGRCLRREVGWLDVARVRVAGIAYNLRHLNPPLSSTLIVVVLEALLFPVTQIPLLVLTCSPSVSCWLGGCYTAWSAEFTVSFILSVLLLALRIAAGAWLCVELRWRQLQCDGVVCSDDDASNSLVRRNQTWDYFVNHCDRSLLRSMYVSTELSYIAWGPVVKLVFDVALVLAASLPSTDSVVQKVAVGIVYAVRGVMLCYTNPNLLLPLDVLAKAVVVHQLVVVGLSSAAIGEEGAGTAIVAVMLCVTSLFLIFVGVVMSKTLVVPLLTAMWNESMSALVRRDAQSSLLHNHPETLTRMLVMQVETLRRKRQLCAALCDRIQATMLGLCSSLPYHLEYPKRGGSQVAITAAMVVRTARELQRQARASGSAEVLRTDRQTKALHDVHGHAAKFGDADLAAIKSTCSALLLDWLGSVTSCEAFHDADYSAFSLSTRQLLDYERDSLGDFLQRLWRRDVDSESMREEFGIGADTQLFDEKQERLGLLKVVVDKEYRLSLLLKVTRFMKPHTTASDGAYPGPMTHCNQLQILSAAKLTDGLDFSECSLNGCRLVRGTRITACNARRSDLSRVEMPECTLASCDIRDTFCLPQSFSSTAVTLTLPHSECVNSAGFSPDGALIVSGSDDKTVRVWDASSGAELRVLSGHNDYVTSVALSPDGARIASGSADKTVRLWDSSSGAELRALTGHQDGVTSVALSPDGARIASGSADKTVRVWDASSGAELQVLSGHNANVTSVAFSPDGTRIVSGSNDSTVRLWDSSSGAELQVLKAHTDTVMCVAFSPDGLRIVSGANDKTLRVFDSSSGAELQVIVGHDSWVTSVAFSPDGARIVSGSWDKTVRVWDASSGAELRVYSGHTSWVMSVAFSPDGTRILSGSNDSTVRLWDSSSGAELRIPTGHTSFVNSVAFSPDGARIVSGSWDKTVRVWDASSGAELQVLTGHQGNVTSVAISPDGRVISGSADTTVRVWDANSGAELWVLTGHQDGVTSVTTSPDGSRIVSGSADKTVRLWDSSSGAELRVLTGHNENVMSVAFSSDGARIVSAGWDKTARLWDSSSGAELRVLSGHKGNVMCVAFSPDGSRIVSGSHDKTMRVWDASSGAEQLRVTGHNVTSVAFSLDGSRIVSGCWDEIVRVFDASSGAELRVFKGHKDVVSSVAVSADGAHIVSGSNDNTVCVWIADELRAHTGRNEYVDTVVPPVDGVDIGVERLFGHSRALTFAFRADPCGLNEFPSLALCVGGDAGRFSIQSCRAEM